MRTAIPGNRVIQPPPLPASVETEKALLSSILLAPDKTLALLNREAVTADYFHHPAHAQIFTAILDLHDSFRPIDFITLAQFLDDTGRIKEVGGHAYITEIFTFAPTASNASYYLEILRDKRWLRTTRRAADLLTAGDIDDALALLDTARRPSSSGLPPILNAADWCATPLDLPPELIEGLLHQGGKLVLGGGSKSFKTWTLLDLALSVASGAEFLGFPCRPARVLFVNLEIQPEFFKQRIHHLTAARPGLSTAGLDVLNLRGFATDAAVLLPQVTRHTRDRGYGLILLDPIYKLLGGRDENASRDITDLMNILERLALDTRAAVAFGSHFAKGNAAAKNTIDRISGSGVFARDPDTILTMTPHETPDAYTLEFTLRNHPPIAPFVVRRRHPLMIPDLTLDPRKLKQIGGRHPETSPDEVLALLGNDALSFSEWAAKAEEALLISRDTFKRRLKKLKAARLIRQSPLEDNKYVRP